VIMATREIGPLEVVELMAALDRGSEVAAEPAMRDAVERAKENLLPRMDTDGEA